MSRTNRIWLITILFIATTFLFFFYFTLIKDDTVYPNHAFGGETSYKSSSMIFEIEKKEHHIEPGEYIKMWVVGSNANDNSPNKERYKVMIEDARIYNLLAEGNDYFVNIQGVKKRNQSEYIFTFAQLGLVDETRITGKGKIE